MTFVPYFVLPVHAGSALVSAGETEKALGVVEREFVQNVAHAFLVPLGNFLNGDCKTIAVSVDIICGRLVSAQCVLSINETFECKCKNEWVSWEGVNRTC